MKEKIFGIDLGTTNSLIYYNDKCYGGMIPSVVNAINKRAGKEFKHTYEEYVFRSFKKDMSLGKEGAVSVRASSLVLKELVKQVDDYDVKKVVISVPAQFSDNARQATIKAAEDIGLEVMSIINEPTAAALKYCKSKMILSLVFDLGGGTFDVSVIDSRYGKYDVIDSRGLILGGDDLDKGLLKLLVNKRIVYLHKMHSHDKEKLKDMCEEAKMWIQNKKEDYVFNLSEFAHCTSQLEYKLTVEEYIDVMKTVFKKTAILTKRIVNDSIADANYNFIFVGGSTRCPYLREWIESEIKHEAVPIDYNQDTLVAEGVAYYAKLMEDGLTESMISNIIPMPVSIELKDGTSKVLIPKGTKLPCEESKLLTSTERCSGLNIKVYQGESIIASNNYFIGNLKYEFDEVKEPCEANVFITISVDNDGIITVKGKEPGRKVQTITLDREVMTKSDEHK